MLKRLGQAVANEAAKQVMKGLVESYSAKWDFESVYDMASRGVGVDQLFPQAYLGVLREQGRRFPNIRDNFALKEFLEWVRLGNPELFNQVAETPEVMRWLSQGWAEARRVLFTDDQ